MPDVSDNEIAADIQGTARRVGVTALGRSQYLQRGKFSQHQVYDGGRNWDSLCAIAGVRSLKVMAVGDDTCFDRLRRAVDQLHRLPTAKEREKYGLDFSKRRYPTASAFIERATEPGVISAPAQPEKKLSAAPELPPSRFQAIAPSATRRPTSRCSGPGGIDCSSKQRRSEFGRFDEANGVAGLQGRRADGTRHESA